MSVSPITKIIEKALEIKGRKSLKTIDRNSAHAMETNTALLMRLMQDNKDTEYGKLHHFGEIKTVEDYKKNVPLSDYDTYAPYIERMIRNKETNLITAYNIPQYAATSGTVGVQKMIPVSDRSMDVYANYTITRVSALAQEHYKKQGKNIPRGRGLNTLEVEPFSTDDGTPCGSVSGTASTRYKKIFPYYLTSPLPVLFPHGGMNMQYMKARFALEDEDMIFVFSVFMTNIVDVLFYMKNNWEMIVDDIEHGTVSPEVCDKDALKDLLPYLKPNPKRAAELREIFRQGFDEPIVPKLWPKLSWLCAIGTAGFATYTEKARTFVGDLPIDFSIYGASEGMFAASRFMNDPRFVLLTDSCFFEFLPANAPTNVDPASTLTLDQLEEGQEYEIIITNQCGFYRYRIMDVIKVLGHYGTCPLITFAYRKSQMVNLAAEKTTEEHLDAACKSFGEKYDCSIGDYALYVDYEVSPARYVLLLESDRELDPTKLEEYSAVFEECLCKANPEYALCRSDRDIGDPVVLLQQQQTHALWRELKIHKGASANQVKPVRILDVPMKQKFFFGLLSEGNEHVIRIDL